MYAGLVVDVVVVIKTEGYKDNKWHGLECAIISRNSKDERVGVTMITQSIGIISTFLKGGARNIIISEPQIICRA